MEVATPLQLSRAAESGSGHTGHLIAIRAMAEELGAKMLIAAAESVTDRRRPRLQQYAEQKHWIHASHAGHSGEMERCHGEKSVEPMRARACISDRRFAEFKKRTPSGRTDQPDGGT